MPEESKSWRNGTNPIKVVRMPRISYFIIVTIYRWFDIFTKILKFISIIQRYYENFEGLKKLESNHQMRLAKIINQTQENKNLKKNPVAMMIMNGSRRTNSTKIFYLNRTEDESGISGTAGLLRFCF